MPPKTPPGTRYAPREGALDSPPIPPAESASGQPEGWSDYAAILALVDEIAELKERVAALEKGEP